MNFEPKVNELEHMPNDDNNITTRREIALPASLSTRTRENKEKTRQKAKKK